MNAKEMFKKLKLNCYDIDYIDDEPIRILYHNNNGTRVNISKKGIEYTENYDRNPLPLYFLPAINKQIEELGWNNE